MSNFFKRVVLLIVVFSLLSTTAFAAFPEDESDGPEKTDLTVWTVPELNSDDHIKYISGFSEKDGSCYRFEPNGRLTRAQAAKMFYTLLTDKGGGPYDASFTDVKRSEWYYKPVQILASNGILEGYSDDRFLPGKDITRAEFVTMLGRLIETEPGECGFKDVNKSAWYYDAVAAAMKMNWVKGYEDGSFGPDRTITRAEAVAVINRALGRSADEATLKNVGFVLYTDVSDQKFWAYSDIMEASMEHGYERTENGEKWTEYKVPQNGLKPGMRKIGSAYYYVDEENGAFVRNSWKTVDGELYYFGDQGKRYTGILELDGVYYFCNPARNDALSYGKLYQDGYMYEFTPDGGTRTEYEDYMTAKAQLQDSNTDWLIMVDLTDCRLGLYRRSEYGWEQDQLWDCSPGKNNSTPTGNFKTGAKGYYFISYGSHCFWYTAFSGSVYLFHSVPCNADGTVQDGTLGEPVSHGCVRLSMENAKWLYDNIPSGTGVCIYRQ